MKKISKQALGIDVAQKELVVSLGCMHEDLSIEIYMHTKFSQIQRMDFRLWYHGYKNE